MSTPVYFLTLSLFMGTVVIIFAMRYFSSLAQARARIAQELSYREMAEQSSAAQAEAATTLGDLKARIARIEAILKEVE
ncbi:MAG: hypothetical protein CFE28_06095 [Alphaproteobacteria bacterium PA2]|nr:MAG: hypothetical protein CFE28_06095 [Alphaproteobacteria bacterium PA2]